jgi:hypothetical protein
MAETEHDSLFTLVLRHAEQKDTKHVTEEKLAKTPFAQNMEKCWNWLVRKKCSKINEDYRKCVDKIIEDAKSKLQ